MRTRLFLFICLVAFQSFGNNNPGIVFCTNRIIIHESPNLKSISLGYLNAGETVSIIDSTRDRFPIGTDELFCKDFPFIKIKSNGGIVGWVSGQFIFRIFDKSDRKSKELMKINPEFKLNNKKFEIRISKNFGIGSVDKEGITGCEDFYPIILVDICENRYFLVENLENPNSKMKFCLLLDDEGTGERIVKMKDNSDTTILKIEGNYQEGTFKYETKIFLAAGKFMGKSINYLKKDE